MVSVLIVSVVSALQVNDVNIINPTEEDSFNEDTIEIEWEWVEETFGSVSSGNLQYSTEGCDGPWNSIFHSFGTGETSYDWDISGLDEGEYCLFLTTNVDDKNDKSEPFTIDRTDPIVVMSDVSFLPDEKDSLVTVAFVHSDNEDVVFCEIDFGGMETEDCLTGSEKSYQFNDDGDYDVIITVKDTAGNIATDSVEVSVSNIAPELIDIIQDEQQIDAPDNSDADDDGLVEAAVGEAVKFTASADDVDEDLEAGLTCRWKFDGSNLEVTTADSNGICKVSHTWDSASEHTVDLTIKDKDGGSVDAIQFELEIEETEQMSPMQQVVADNTFEFDLDETWAVSGEPGQFQTSISGPTDCELVTSINGMTVTEPGSDRCEIDWIPSNNQRGNHLVIIKAVDAAGDEFKYYSFDVTVYSWGIELVPGWNLISIPYVPTSSDIDDVFADIIDNVVYEDTSTATVFQYDATYNKNEGRWYKARPTSTHTSFTWSSSNYKLENIVPGYAYWIKMENEDTIYGVEENFNPGQGPVPSIELAKDAWNLIGTYAISPVNDDVALETLDGNWYTNGLLKWNGINSWDAVTVMQPLEGYWLRTKYIQDRDTLSYEPLGYYFL